MTVLFDSRWSGKLGLGRFAVEVRDRLAGPVVDLFGSDPLTARGLLETEILPQLNGQQGADDLFYSPGYTPPLNWEGPAAITIHDLPHLDAPRHASGTRKVYFEQVVKRVLRRPEVTVLTVSKHSQQRIADWAGVPAERLHVVGNGVDAHYSPAGDAVRRERPYVLHVGSTRAHKNLARLITAMAGIPDVELVLSAAPDRQLLALAYRLGMGKRITFCSGIPEADLPSWYRGAAAVAAPSLHEGFGLAALEGMATGVPVVASNTGALGELVDGAGILVDPLDIESIRHGLERALGDVSLRAELTLTGPQRAAGFTWDHVGTRVNRALGLVREDAPLPPLAPGGPRLAVAHDYLTQRGGAERVAVTLAQSFPQAPIVTSLYEPDTTYPQFAGHNIITSPLNKVGLLRRSFRLALPLFGWAFRNTAVPADADVVICSTTGFAHGVRTLGETRKLVYCHSPARFLYLVDDYLGQPWWRTPKGWALMALRPGLIAWDKRAARSADGYLCNSTVVAERIKKVYGIDAKVVHPPNALDSSGPQEAIPGVEPGFFLVVSRLMPYKNVDVVLDAIAGLPNERLVVIGRGPLRDRLRAQAPSNAMLVEGLSDAQMRWAYANSQAVIAPSHEDFGLTPVEGFGYGKPTLALHAGGYLDTVIDGRSGYFFEAATPEAIRGAISRLAAHPLPAGPILEHAEKFSNEHFIAEIRAAAAQVAESPRVKARV